MIGRYVLAWFPMVVIAIANGTLRVGTYGKRMSELRAHQLSTLTGLLLFSAYFALLALVWPLPSAAQAWQIGILWLLMTVAFEFLFGHYVARHSWSLLLRDYNVFKGRVWVLVLVWVLTAPYVFFSLQHRG